MPIQRERRFRLAAKRWQDLPRTKPPSPGRKKSLADLVGTLDDESARQMIRAIEDAFERVEDGA